MSQETLTTLAEGLDKTRIPRHVAIIMDGNGRWAQLRGLHRSAGHYEGVNSVRDVTEQAGHLGIKYLSLYAFSTENWARPQQEVDTLMHLISSAIESETPALMRNNVRLLLAGDIERLPQQARESLERSRKLLDSCTGLNLILCLNYSARWELSRAARMIAREAADGSLDPNAVDDTQITERLATFPAPDPDLLIRTGGEQRVSNFLLWQIAYSELLFTDILWPDFRGKQLIEAVAEYQTRERRFGKTSEQVRDDASNQENTPL